MANPSPDKGNAASRAPRVEACIQDAMEKYAGGSPGRDLTYYQNVHQDLAPLARELENALSIANARIAELERATPPSPSTAPEHSLFANCESSTAKHSGSFTSEVDERAAFEAWAVPREFDLRRPHKTYHNTCADYAWMGWQARAALASRPAEVDDEGQPPLPPEAARASKGKGAFFMKWSETGKELRGALMLYTAEQFRQGQRDAVVADRAKVAKAVGLLREARAALETWKDMAPAVSLRVDIDKVLSGGGR